ncbi:MAG: hypothetical protein AAB920_00550 [Patescibacteria group bacterium]
MKSPEVFGNIEKTQNEEVSESVQKIGIGHMPEDTQFSPDSINDAAKSEVIETYNKCTKNIESLSNTLDSLVSEINTEHRGKKVFSDMLGGIAEAMHRTANQILYHAKTDPKESLAAFDEFSMMLEPINQSIMSPHVLSKKNILIRQPINWCLRKMWRAMRLKPSTLYSRKIILRLI